MRTDRTVRPFICQTCKMMVGLIIKDADFVERLNVFRSAWIWLPASSIPGVPNIEAFAQGETVEQHKALFSTIHLDSGTVVCPNCEALYEWNLSKAALEKLLSRRRSRTYGLEA